VTAAGLAAASGRVRRPGRRATSDRPSARSPQLEERLRADPFAAPEGPDLDALRLGRPRAGRRRARRAAAAPARRGGAAARRPGPGDAGARRARAAVHAQPGAAGARDDAAGGRPRCSSTSTAAGGRGGWTDRCARSGDRFAVP
jgi:selenocysteine-specific elongation factor